MVKVKSGHNSIESAVLDHAAIEIAGGSKLGIDAAKKIPGERSKRFWPPMVEMDEAVKAKGREASWRHRACAAAMNTEERIVHITVLPG